MRLFRNQKNEKIWEVYDDGCKFTTPEHVKAEIRMDSQYRITRLVLNDCTPEEARQIKQLAYSHHKQHAPTTGGRQDALREKSDQLMDFGGTSAPIRGMAEKALDAALSGVGIAVSTRALRN